MSIFDKAKDLAQKGVEGANQIREDSKQSSQKRKEDKQEELNTKGVVAQLKSLKGALTLYDDRVEITNLLGSKNKVVPYAKIESVSLGKTSSVAKGAAAAVTLGASLAVTNKKTVVISTGGEQIAIDVRTEKLDHVQKVVDIINEKIKTGNQQNVKVSVDGVSGSSDADELAKFAKLKDQGVITEEEFSKKKTEILGL